MEEERDEEEEEKTLNVPEQLLPKINFEGFKWSLSTAGST
jgi:hypothetical protein